LERIDDSQRLRRHLQQAKLEKFRTRIIGVQLTGPPFGIGLQIPCLTKIS
jgi:hypothetical protein